MTATHRITLALLAGTLAVGLAASPAAYAMDSMKGAMMHKHMKKHKGSMMKGDAMKNDAAPKADAPAQ